MLHYLHLANTCFWWKDLPTIMGRTAEVVIIFPLSSMMFFWHSSVTRRVPVVPVELPSLYMPMAHSNLHRFHVQSWNTFSTTGFSETTQAILIISPYSRKVYNLKFYDGSSMHSLPRYADMLMAQELFQLAPNRSWCFCFIFWLIFQTPLVSFDSQKGPIR